MVFATATASIMLLGLPAPREARSQVTGLFSSLVYHDEAGDLLGMEVYLVVGAKGEYFAVVQCAGGEPSEPAVVRARILDTRVTFTLPAGLPECGTEFSGVISSEGLRGRFHADTAERWLPRKRGYWQ